MKYSVVTTEKNEAGSIEDFIKGLLNQSLKPTEIVICDGGSTDGTVEVIKSYSRQGVKLVIKTGNRSVGRNEAIRKASHEIVAVTDVGTVADRDWLKNITKPFEDPTISVVGGFFKIKPENLFEKISATQMLSDHENIDPEVWLPSSRSIAFKKEAWKKVGGYPEHTRYNEDTPFDLDLKKAGYKFSFARDAVVYWRPRPNLVEFFKQYYNYAIGDGLDLIHWANYLRKIAVYAGGLSLLVVYWPLAAILAGLYFIKKGWRVFKKFPSFETVVISPFVTVTNDLADILGFLKGLTSKRS